MILQVGNPEHVKVVSTKALSGIRPSKRRSVLDVLLSSASPSAPTLLSSGQVVLAFFCIRVQTCWITALLAVFSSLCSLNVHSKAGWPPFQCLLCSQIPRWAMMRMALSLCWVFVSVVCHISVSFCPFPWTYLACTSVTRALWNASRCVGCLRVPSLLESPSLSADGQVPLSVCSSRTKGSRRHTTSKALSSR